MKFFKIVSFTFLLLSALSSFSQSKDIKLPANWYNLDLVKDGYFGISTEKAYSTLLNGKTPKQKIIVAVIDGGVDINHEDLKDVLWTNTKEITGNGLDDDGNGYIDDIHGWNFIGSNKGNLAYDNLELVRIMRKYAPLYTSTLPSTVLDSTQKEEFRLFTKARTKFGVLYNNAVDNFRYLSVINHVIDSVARVNSKPIPSAEDFDKYVADNEEEEQVKKIIRAGIKENKGVEKFVAEMKDAYEQYDVMLRYNLNLKYNERQELVGDNYEDAKQRNYGNKDVMGPNAEHGSHVSGIIAASRNNGLGVNGISNSASIMAIRVVPEGDERDKDVANGIIYAVDNGAKVINMSFGKSFKWNKKAVDDAVKYAEQKGVLLVHAAGNDNENNDVSENYPNKYFETPESIAYEKAHRKSIGLLPVIKADIPMNNPYDRNRRPTSATFKKLPMDTTKFGFAHASNWIEVGASSYYNDPNLKATFSNYGKHTVDVFAPGFMINSTIPGSKYKEFDGTSMASPVVSGLAALILSYYPDLKPAEVRDIIMKSVSKVDIKVKHKDEKGQSTRIAFTELCTSGGVVNAYQALLLAEKYKK
jgi:cell wall-associated protease